MWQVTLLFLEMVLSLFSDLYESNIAFKGIGGD
jgi:hypothetical protein